MGHEDHKHSAPKSVRCAVLTVSDTRSNDDDGSGRAIVDLLKVAGHFPVYLGVVSDDVEAIRGALGSALADTTVQAIVVNGGTGIARRDVTVEAVGPLLERTLPGFGELFRALSFQQIGSAAMMSRATAGIARGRPVFCLPGSEGAVRLAVERLIAPELGHIVWEAGR